MPNWVSDVVIGLGDRWPDGADVIRLAGQLVARSVLLMAQIECFTIPGVNVPVGVLPGWVQGVGLGSWVVLIGGVGVGLGRVAASRGARRGGDGVVIGRARPVPAGPLTAAVGVLVAAVWVTDGVTALLLARPGWAQRLQVITLSGDEIASFLPSAGRAGPAEAMTLLGFGAAALIYLVELAARLVAIVGLAAVVPVVVATRPARPWPPWLLGALRWAAVAIVIKPVCAWVLLIGVVEVAPVGGLVALVASVSVLVIIGLCPLLAVRGLNLVSPASRTIDQATENQSEDRGTGQISGAASGRGPLLRHRRGSCRAIRPGSGAARSARGRERRACGNSVWPVVRDVTRRDETDWNVTDGDVTDGDVTDGDVTDWAAVRGVAGCGRARRGPADNVSTRRRTRPARAMPCHRLGADGLGRAAAASTEPPTDRIPVVAPGSGPAVAEPATVQSDIREPRDDVIGSIEPRPMTAMKWSLRIFGSPSLSMVSGHRDDDRGMGAISDVTAKLSPRMLELLVFMALHPHGVRRDAIVAALWPETGRRRPANNLSALITRLRAAVAVDARASDPADTPERADSPGRADAPGRTQTDSSSDRADLLSVDGDCYSLDPAHVSVDYWEFLAAFHVNWANDNPHDDLAAARRTSRPKSGSSSGSGSGARLHEDTRAALQIAHELYRGSLAEGMDAEWVLSVREAARRSFLTATARLVRHHVEAAPAFALRLLERARNLDPTNESLYRDIIALQLQAGDHEAAANTLRLLETQLADIEESVSDATVALARHIHRLRRADEARNVGLTDSGPHRPGSMVSQLGERDRPADRPRRPAHEPSSRASE